MCPAGLQVRIGSQCPAARGGGRPEQSTVVKRLLFSFRLVARKATYSSACRTRPVHNQAKRQAPEVKAALKLSLNLSRLLLRGTRALEIRDGARERLRVGRGLRAREREG